MAESKTDAVIPLLDKLLDSEWRRILKPVLRKRLSLYFREAETMPVHCGRMTDPTMPYESALAELIYAIDPDIESGDILADAHTAAMAALVARESHPERASVPDELRARVAKLLAMIEAHQYGIKGFGDGSLREGRNFTDEECCTVKDAMRIVAVPQTERVIVPEARTWITADSNTRSDIVSVLREEANEREQEDRGAGIFSDFAGSTLLAAIANSLEADTLWAVAAPQPGQQP